MQSFIETGDPKLNDIQFSSDELPKIYNKFENSQIELELSNDTYYSVDRQQFVDYFEVTIKLNEHLHRVVEPRYRHSSPRSRLSGNSNNFPMSHVSSVQIKLPTIALPTFEGDTCSWLNYRDTFVALIINNKTLSNVKKFQYLIASFKNKAKDLINNLEITNENILVSWQ